MVSKKLFSSTRKRNMRHFFPGQTVMTRNYNSRPKWVRGTVLRQTGPVSVTVNVAEMTWRRRLDQICESNFYPAVVSATTFVSQPTTNTDAVTSACVILEIPATNVAVPVSTPPRPEPRDSPTTTVETYVHRPAERRYSVLGNRNRRPVSKTRPLSSYYYYYIAIYT